VCVCVCVKERWRVKKGIILIISAED